MIRSLCEQSRVTTHTANPAAALPGSPDPSHCPVCPHPTAYENMSDFSWFPTKFLHVSQMELGV